MQALLTFLRDREWVATTDAIGMGLAAAEFELDLVSDTIEEVGLPEPGNWLAWAILAVTAYFTRRGVNSNATVAQHEADLAEHAARAGI